jgi:GGDEF domain-containing protein
MDSGSVMVAAISLGICVDHSIHFMGRYIQNSRTFAGQKRALQETLQHSTLPIVATALALTGGFLVLAFSSFPPVARFGLLSALVMLLALVSTFVILPLLLKYTRFIDLWDAIDVHLDRSRVLDCPLFADIPHRGVRRLIKLAKLGVIAPHKPIVTQGQSVDRIYVILEGSADAWHTQADGSIVRKARLLPGELFGELPMITNGQCLADIICQERTVVLTLRTSVLRQFSQIYPKWAAQLHMNLLTIVGAEIGRLQRSGQSVLDQLTGTFNQASFEQLVSSFVAQAERHNESLIMLSVRITNAPALIEQSSRSAYMDFLQGVAKAIQTHTRQADFCSRRGLDEFHVLLPKTDREGAESVIRKIRDNLPDRGFGPIWADIAFSPQQLTRETSGRTMDPPTEPLGGLPPAALMAK